MNRYKLFYAVYNDNSYDIFDNLKNASASSPNYIIELSSKGHSISRFPERTVEDEHFDIKYFKPNGNQIYFYNNKWKILEIHDQIRYGIIITVKIGNSEGKIRIFDVWNSNCHYENTFSNRIEDLIELYDFFYKISNYKSWEEIEYSMSDNSNEIPCEISKHLSSKGKLNKYY